MSEKKLYRPIIPVIMLVSGLLLWVIGYNLITSFDGRGLNDLGGFIFVILLLIGGSILVLVALGYWFARLISKRNGAIAVLLIAVVLFIYWLATKAPSVVEFDQPVEAISLGAEILPESVRTSIEIPEGEPIKLYAVTNNFKWGYPVFKIGFGDNQRANISGRHICATTQWVNGLFSVCSASEPGNSNPEPIDIISNALMHLDGVWMVTEKYEEERGLLVFGDYEYGRFIHIRDSLGFGLGQPQYDAYRLEFDEEKNKVVLYDIDRENLQKTGQNITLYISSIDSMNLVIQRDSRVSDGLTEERKFVRVE